MMIKDLNVDGGCDMENQVVAVQPETVEEMNAELTQKFEMNSLSQEDMTRIKEIADEIDVEDSQYVLQYGVSIQSQISQFADKKAQGKTSVLWAPKETTLYPCEFWHWFVILTL